MGLFVFYFGTDRRYPDTAHHTILLGHRYRELLDEIFGRPAAVPEDLSLYLHRPTATDPGMAPAGCDAFYVLAPVPNLRAGIDWASAGPRLRDRLVAMLEERELPGLASAIVTESWMTPETFRQDYRSRHGTGFSVSPRLTQSAWFRFHNKSEEVAGLYLVGAGTHPGAGLPGVLTSAKVVEALLREER
jgi:phytoene desaturase